MKIEMENNNTNMQLIRKDSNILIYIRSSVETKSKQFSSKERQETTILNYIRYNYDLTEEQLNATPRYEDLGVKSGLPLQNRAGWTNMVNKIRALKAFHPDREITIVVEDETRIGRTLPIWKELQIYIKKNKNININTTNQMNIHYYIETDERLSLFVDIIEKTYINMINRSIAARKILAAKMKEAGVISYGGLGKVGGPKKILEQYAWLEEYIVNNILNSKYEDFNELLYKEKSLKLKRTTYFRLKSWVSENYKQLSEKYNIITTK